MGMNALIVYALAACELFPAAIQGFYWQSPENNLVNPLYLASLFSFTSAYFSCIDVILFYFLFLIISLQLSNLYLARLEEFNLF